MGREIAGKFEIPYWDQKLCGMNHITKWGYCFYKERPNNSFFFFSTKCYFLTPLGEALAWGGGGSWRR